MIFSIFKLKLSSFAADIFGKIAKHEMLMKSLVWIGFSSHKKWKRELVFLVLATVFYTFYSMGSTWL